jgi:GTP-binding protein
MEIWKRLKLESESDVSLRVVDDPKKNMINIQGRGDLHLGILIEKMRREGYELSITPPEVVYKYEGNKKMEPMEKLEVEVMSDHSAKVIELLQ